jgi:hypothetical protein
MKHRGDHVVGLVIIAVLILVTAVGLVCLFSPRLRPRFLKLLYLLFGGLIAIYAVGRGIAEFWVVNYSNPSSYRHSWGGPSLLGVFAVHSGPGLVVLIGAIYLIYRNSKKKRRNKTEPIA